jgi:hypothetical protein
MPITIEGAGTISGLSTGGLPNGSVAQADLAAGVAGNGPAFRARIASNLTVTNLVNTKAPLTVEDYDTANCFDTSLNRFTPNVAGYYMITAKLYMEAASALQGGFLYIYKNGSSVSMSGLADSSAALSAAVFTTSELVYMNGTTDYVEMWAVVYGSTPRFEADAAATALTGFLARAA